MLRNFEILNGEGSGTLTLTLTDNVSLASGSVSLFEITPTVTDKLVINGRVGFDTLHRRERCNPTGHVLRPDRRKRRDQL